MVILCVSSISIIPSGPGIPPWEGGGGGGGGGVDDVFDSPNSSW